MEEWRLLGINVNYMISSLGRVMRVTRGRRTRPGLIVRGSVNNEGYRTAVLSQMMDGRKILNGHRITGHRVSGLVAHAFLGPKPESMTVNHKNGDKLDDRAENLEYITHKQQAAHRRGMGGYDHLGARRVELTAPECELLRRKRNTGTTYRELSKRFGVSVHTAYNIANGLTRRRLKSGPWSERNR